MEWLVGILLQYAVIRHSILSGRDFPVPHRSE